MALLTNTSIQCPLSAHPNDIAWSCLGHSRLKAHGSTSWFALEWDNGFDTCWKHLQLFLARFDTMPSHHLSFTPPLCCWGDYRGSSPFASCPMHYFVHLSQSYCDHHPVLLFLRSSRLRGAHSNPVDSAATGIWHSKEPQDVSIVGEWCRLVPFFFFF